jgi:hypothetical protein
MLKWLLRTDDPDDDEQDGVPDPPDPDEPGDNPPVVIRA